MICRIHIYIVYYISIRLPLLLSLLGLLLLPIDCLLLALDAHMLSHNEYGPGPRAQKGRGPGPGPAQRPFWALGSGSRAHIHYG